jgi:hypothetical protein
MENQPPQNQPLESQLTLCPKCGAFATAKKEENGVVIGVCSQLTCGNEWPVPQVKAATPRS